MEMKIRYPEFFVNKTTITDREVSIFEICECKGCAAP